MKKTALLNSNISSVISQLGHTDTLVIGDAGLPIPETTTRIDLALTHNVPTFLQVVSIVTSEMQVEAAILAQEIREKNPTVHDALLEQLKQLEQHQGNTIALHYVSHEELKTQSGKSRAIIRSGECSPYANVILCAGVTF
ncbi:D-ribose pyranase [Samsonia erythrinae]|uniref:D-ribose pyranase n=1 Tax=Samsonia erythrinae TaxID=160434 RepID=A0A4R3VHG3_9GAMM|nr:D-ribose pyranase [Samsonia erythrinae]TCV04957.1 ribose transport protein RbsD [Samsonia erythrinae]